jgi:hypothetical protein
LITWAPILDRAAEIVHQYSEKITLRQLFYRLVSEQLIANTEYNYKHLSELTAKARREGSFPALIDLTREVAWRRGWDSPRQAVQGIVSSYQRGHTEGQPWLIVLGVEKRGIRAQLLDWFGYDYHVPVEAISGYDSQSHADEMRELIEDDGRPAVLLYAGDFDPSGEDIMRDFLARTDCWEKVVHIALTDEQVATFALPQNPGKSADSRAAAFAARHGRLVQVELDALAPDQLRGLYQQAFDGYWDTSQYQAVLAREARERAELLDFADSWPQDE